MQQVVEGSYIFISLQKLGDMTCIKHKPLMPCEINKKMSFTTHNHVYVKYLASETPVLETKAPTRNIELYNAIGKGGYGKSKHEFV